MSEMTAASINERAAEEYFRRGLESEQSGNHEKAAEFYERALSENPDHERACFSLGRALRPPGRRRQGHRALRADDHKPARCISMP